MSIIKTVTGILVEKNPKKFADGREGFFCTLLLPDEKLLNFWTGKEHENYLGTVQEVEGYESDAATGFRLKLKEWNGAKKYTLCPAIM